MQLDEKSTAALLKALRTLADEYELDIDDTALGEEQKQPHPQDAAFYLETLFALRTVSHTEEQGEAPSGAYPRLLASYAQASGGAFEPEDIAADTDDDWDSLTLTFRYAGKKQRIKVNGVEDSDWFAPDFVKALNKFAKRVGLPGRWVDFHNGDDACTSIYVPEMAQARFKTLRKKYSTVAESNDSGWTPELEASARLHSLHFPPALEGQLDKAQMAQRKAAWPPIETRLWAYHSKSDVKLFERYYLRGTEPNSNDFWTSDPIPLVYRLWLHPDQSDASWCAITERVLSYRGDGDNELHRQRYVGYSLGESRDILERQNDGNLELFGEARERLTQFLQGDTPPGDRYRHQGERLYYYDAFARPDYSLQCDWLMAATPEDKRGIRYDATLAERWVDYLCGPDAERFMDRGWHYSPLRFFKVFLHLVAHYPSPTDDSLDHARRQYCQRYREALEARALPVRLQAWWEKLKTMTNDREAAKALE